MFSHNKPYYNNDYSENDPENMDELTSNAITTTTSNIIDITGSVNLRLGSVSEAISGAIKLNASGIQAHSTGLFCTNIESADLQKGENKLIFNTSTNEIQRSSTSATTTESITFNKVLGSNWTNATLTGDDGTTHTLSTSGTTLDLNPEVEWVITMTGSPSYYGLHVFNVLVGATSAQQSKRAYTLQINDGSFEYSTYELTFKADGDDD